MKTFRNGKLDEFVDIYDTDGRVVNASDGGIIFADGKYHLYGQALRDLPEGYRGAGGQVTETGVVMYCSEDLVKWEYEGVVLSCEEGELRAPMRFERPKIIYNEKTGRYVLWCHYVEYPGGHGFEKGKGEIGVAVSDSVNGCYRWLGHFRPIDDDGVVRDRTLYKDSDGTAYLIFDRDISLIEKANRCLYIVKLSEDYLSCTDEYRRIDPAYRREAAILYHGGYYYMIPRECRDEASTTFNSQTSYVFSPDGGESFIHVSERHNTKSFLHCSYISSR